MYYLGVDRKTSHFHHKTKTKFIFLTELMILIFGENVQLILRTYFFSNWVYSYAITVAIATT